MKIIKAKAQGQSGKCMMRFVPNAEKHAKCLLSLQKIGLFIAEIATNHADQDTNNILII